MLQLDLAKSLLDAHNTTIEYLAHTKILPLCPGPFPSLLLSLRFLYTADVFKGTPFWRPRSKGVPSPGDPAARNFVTRNYSLCGTAHGEFFVIIACIALIRLQSVADGQKNRQTDRYLDER